MICCLSLNGKTSRLYELVPLNTDQVMRQGYRSNSCDFMKIDDITMVFILYPLLKESNIYIYINVQSLGGQRTLPFVDPLSNFKQMTIPCNVIRLFFVCNMSKCSKCGTGILHLCPWKYKNTLDEDIRLATEATTHLPSVQSNRWHSRSCLQNSLEFNMCFKCIIVG